MNGKFINEATTLAKSPTLTADLRKAGGDDGTADRVAVCDRRSAASRPRRNARNWRATCRGMGRRKRIARLADVFWMLLNSAEFRLNH